MERFYPIGTPGVAWNDSEKRAWFESRSIERSYQDEVLIKLDALHNSMEVIQYGYLPVNPKRYTLMAVKVPATRVDAPWVLITGGVHGYETSGVQGAIAFLETTAASYRDCVSFVVAPCVSPWGYEVINRWNPGCIDPNRSFFVGSPSEEAAALMKMLDGLGRDFLMHMDLHETTDSDENEFRPALAARDGEGFEPGLIPDGFYTVGDSENPQAGFQAAIIAGVEQVTHIAPSDAAGQIIGSEMTQQGVINYPCEASGLCTGITGARFTTTTEVYPDSPNSSPVICNEAQIAAVRAGLDFALANS